MGLHPGLAQMYKKKVADLTAVFNIRETVRRQSFWNQRSAKLREGLAHLFGLIMRHVDCDASGASRMSFV